MKNENLEISSLLSVNGFVVVVVRGSEDEIEAPGIFVFKNMGFETAEEIVSKKQPINFRSNEYLVATFRSSPMGHMLASKLVSAETGTHSGRNEKLTCKRCGDHPVESVALTFMRKGGIVANMTISCSTCIDMRFSSSSTCPPIDGDISFKIKESLHTIESLRRILVNDWNRKNR